MNKTYQLKVGGDAVFESENLLHTNINSAKTGIDSYHVLKDNTSYEAKLLSKDFNTKNYIVSVNGNTYTVNIQTDLDNLINKLGFALNSTKQVNSIKAPMPGLILDIVVAVGQEVQENDNLLILEAMKMENNLTSPRAGKIKAINVSKGATVDKGLVLIEFE
ncbi:MULTISPECIES: acetyl-CoA carboxylase biotin carboxyl carrier protein subunit [Myroides]|uniref:Acetyl-CoA carboxylase biotin carboxyl carrier protein subunit n=1 Tax=Myroides albus TaxID=2562892 RepID=A0A6I3LLT8_9FLAO|nr:MULTISPECIES: acetyl-CoA carboxylase biotin carboxyl carrier protein subunit [Myroides]MTG97511.1 acetyl-CoA carboxylase biotin carboxyl carrier protein subunit [Myroides albus]MVX35465.1 acetyl-CoA carboxylase biotin carboxyl carrier protein subunit [Myroides sp. LoEW2-1]UVD81212.1 acetyl-CoA carboxylase biotin carboxyl carrier protein subunit [Myroides albus]